jgi:peptide-methionine (S)-S-oxide reductase
MILTGTLVAWGIGFFAQERSTLQMLDSKDDAKSVPVQRKTDPVLPQLETATFGSGCFWCTEGIFDQVQGVQSVVSGYSGGHTKNPSYTQVCSGTTGHAEVVQITFDPRVVSYTDLLEIFWRTHDPTTHNRQGPDEGTQYRSVVFYHDEQQRALAEEYKQQLDRSGSFQRPIVTEIARFEAFYRAEDYHQNYFELNPRQAYCTAVIRPKIDKFRKDFGSRLKSAK